MYVCIPYMVWCVGGAYAWNGNLMVIISSEKPNLRNYWAGRWTSVWTVKTAVGKTTVSGDIKVTYA